MFLESINDYASSSATETQLQIQKQTTLCISLYNKRLDQWIKGDFDSLVCEARTIQSNLATSKKYKNQEQLQ